MNEREGMEGRGRKSETVREISSEGERHTRQLPPVSRARDNTPSERENETVTERDDQ